MKGHDNAWTPFGSIDPSTHIFAPGTNGNIAPGDCLKWGPGITTAGGPCGSGGGGGGGGFAAVYTSHSGLVNNVTTPTGAAMVMQQGFYAPGDGGDAVYQWNAGSYCSIGTSGAPVATDDVVCIAPGHPAPYTSSTAGRYLLSTGGSIDVRQVGMKAGGFDNAPLVQTLMSAVSPPSQSAGTEILFPPTAGQVDTYFYFSEPFVVARGSRINCKGGVGL